MTRTIIIEIHKDGYVNVGEAGKWFDRLGKDEALWAIVQLMLNGEAKTWGGMKTIEEHVDQAVERKAAQLSRRQASADQDDFEIHF